MRGGSRLKFHAPLRIVDAVRRDSRIAAVEHKSGRTGDLVFVTVEHRITAGARHLIEEEHDIVYRPAPPPDAPPPPEPPPAPGPSAFGRTVEPGPILLLR